MADDDEYDDQVIEEPVEGEPLIVPSMIPQKLVPELALLDALGHGDVRGIRTGKLKTIVLQVPTSQWVVPLVSAIRRLFADAEVVGITERNRFRDNEGSISAIAMNRFTIGVSQDPRSLLPVSLTSTCDRYITLAVPSGKLLTRIARKVLKGRPGAEFQTLKTNGLDFEVLCACLPVRGTKKQSLERFSRAIAARSSSRRADFVPELSEAHGYGEARTWALDLQQDLADFRAGRITFDKIDRGAVLYGPSGSGKSLFAQILAKSCALPFFATSMADLFQNAGDLGAVLKAQRAIFSEARASAPSLLFIDELDGLPNRAKLSNRGRDWWLPVVGDFLVQLDSAVSEDGLIVVGATNLIEQIDEAVLRKGRLERKLWIGPPDPEALAGIMRFYLREELEEADLLGLAQARPGATGAEAREWIRAARRSARRAGRPMTFADLRDKVLPVDPRDANERLRVAVHEAGHATAATLLGTALVTNVSIVLTGSSGGHTAYAPTGQRLALKADLEDRVVVCLAGRAAEEAYFGGPPSSGSGGDGGSDLAMATNLVAQWHVSLGLAKDLVWRGSPDQTLTLMGMDPALRRAVNTELHRLYGEARALMTANLDRVGAVAKALQARRNLSGGELRTIVAEARPGRVLPDAGDPVLPRSPGNRF